MGSRAGFSVEGEKNVPCPCWELKLLLEFCQFLWEVVVNTCRYSKASGIVSSAGRYHQWKNLSDFALPLFKADGHTVGI